MINQLLSKKLITADYTVEQNDRILNCDTSGANIALTLPPHAGIGGYAVEYDYPGTANAAGNVNITVNLVSAAPTNRVLAIANGDTIDTLLPKLVALLPEYTVTQPGGAGTPILAVANEKAWIPANAIDNVNVNIGGNIFRGDVQSFGHDPIVGYRELDIVNTGTGDVTIAATSPDTIQGITTVQAGQARKVVSYGDGGWYIVGDGAGGGGNSNLENVIMWDSNLDTQRVFIQTAPVTVSSIEIDANVISGYTIETSTDGVAWTPRADIAALNTYVKTLTGGNKYYVRLTATYIAGKNQATGAVITYTKT